MADGEFTVEEKVAEARELKAACKKSLLNAYNASNYSFPGGFSKQMSDIKELKSQLVGYDQQLKALCNSGVTISYGITE